MGDGVWELHVGNDRFADAAGKLESCAGSASDKRVANDGHDYRWSWKQVLSAPLAVTIEKPLSPTLSPLDGQREMVGSLRCSPQFWFSETKLTEAADNCRVTNTHTYREVVITRSSGLIF
jgi:hypothetical protein